MTEMGWLNLTDAEIGDMVKLSKAARRHLDLNPLFTLAAQALACTLTGLKSMFT